MIATTLSGLCIVVSLISLFRKRLASRNREYKTYSKDLARDRWLMYGFSLMRNMTIFFRVTPYFIARTGRTLLWPTKISSLSTQDPTTLTESVVWMSWNRTIVRTGNFTRIKVHFM